MSLSELISSVAQPLLDLLPQVHARPASNEWGVKDSLWGKPRTFRGPLLHIPAITHVDYSARVQTVSRERSPDYFDLISKFEEHSGCPLVVNTSFNVRGEPIVCTPEDAYVCFMRTDMDFLVLDSFFLEKTEQPELEEEGDWRDEFELD